MKIWPHILDSHSIYVRKQLSYGYFVEAKQTLHEDVNADLVAEVDHDSDLTAFTAYVAGEYSDDEDDAPTGAVIEILFSKRKGLAALRYDHPDLSDAFIEWVSCHTVEDAMVEWRKKVVAKLTVIDGDISATIDERRNV